MTAIVCTPVRKATELLLIQRVSFYLFLTLLYIATIVLFFSILTFCTVFPSFLTELNKPIYYLNQNSLYNLMVSLIFHMPSPQLILRVFLLSFSFINNMYL